MSSSAPDVSPPQVEALAALLREHLDEDALPSRLAEIEARLKAATPGPWAWWRDPSLVEDGVYAPKHPDTQYDADGKLVDACTVCRGMTGPTREANAQFIAAAPDDIAYLLELARGSSQAGSAPAEPPDYPSMREALQRVSFLLSTKSRWCYVEDHQWHGAPFTGDVHGYRREDMQEIRDLIGDALSNNDERGAGSAPAVSVETFTTAITKLLCAHGNWIRALRNDLKYEVEREHLAGVAQDAEDDVIDMYVAALGAGSAGSPESANERFEREAEAFYRATGYMAPGKDVPVGMGATSDYEMRRSIAWEAWCAGIAYRGAASPSSGEPSREDKKGVEP